MPAVLPGALLPNYALLASGDAAPSQGIFIPLASLSGLTAAEAATATGDGRKVVFEFIRTAFGSFSGLATADRPARLSMTRATPQGVDATTMRQAYTLSFDLDVSAVDMSPEP